MPSIKAGNNHEIQSRKAESERIEPLSPTLSSSCTTYPRETGTSNMPQDGTESSSLYKLASSALAIKGKHKSSSDTTKHESALNETEKISREYGKVNEKFHLQANETESSRPSSRLKTSHDNMNDLEENNAELNQAKKQKTHSVSTSAGRTAAVQEGAVEGKKRPVKTDQSKAQHDIFREIRMERKRKREMQRRSNVNRELDHMAELITSINPPEMRNMLNNKYIDDNNHAPLNRLELIHVAVKTIERLHYQSEKDASRIYELTMELNTMKEMINHDKVTMMFPVMVPKNERINTGDPIPNGSIFLPPRIPNNLLKTRQAPTLYNVPPFPDNSMFSQIPSVLNMPKQMLPTSNPLPSGANNSEPHYVLLPDNCARNFHISSNNQLLNMNNEELKALLAAKIASQIGHRPL